MVKEPILRMDNISKSFPGVLANNKVNLSLYKGEIHALLGENGAGKSTLMNILTGIYKQSEGNIFYNGQKINLKSPKDAVRLGIGMVHQHFRLVSPMSVAENILMGTKDCKFFIKRHEMEKTITEYSAKYHLEVDPNAKIWQLSVGEQQRVEIVKLLFRGAEILILDEPTAVLTPKETEAMFAVLRNMADDGKAIVFITHKMSEVIQYADRITVLRDGMSVAAMLKNGVGADELTKLTIGQPKQKIRNNDACKREECVLELKNVTVFNDRVLPALKNVNMKVHRGEIVGIAGVAGNGQKELSEAIAGLRGVAEGEIIFKGTNVKSKSVKKRIQEGVAYIPEDRLGMGLIPKMNMMENAILKAFENNGFSKFGFLLKKRIQDYAAGLGNTYNIKNAGHHRPVALMSGGNQQKLLIGREVSDCPDLIVAAYPVRGLDAGAAESINHILLEQRRRGAAILLIMEDLEQIFEMSDTIVVLYNHRAVSSYDAAEASLQAVGSDMVGSSYRPVKKTMEGPLVGSLVHV
jgi:simple sugar transport system ATP-binding protein